MYFITIEKIISILHYNGFIENQLDINNNLSLRWVKPTTESTISDTTIVRKRILVTGSSGAGKSSFIKSFASNANLIESIGDGQTTRCIYHYNFSRKYCYDNKSYIAFKLLTQEKFRVNRTSRIHFKIIEWIFENYIFPESFKQSITIYEDSYIYLKYIYDKLVSTKINNADAETALLECIDKICDSSFYKINEESTTVFNYYRKFFNQLHTMNKRDQNTFKNLGMRVDASSLYSYIINSTSTNIINYKELANILLHDEGLFNIKEFDFLLANKHKDIYKDFQCWYEFLVEDKIEALQPYLINILNYSLRFDDIKLNKSPIDLFFNELHQFLKFAINVYMSDLLKKNTTEADSFHLFFNTIEKNSKIKELSQCLFKITENNNSLTAMIDYIDIFDNFSEEYAFMFDDIGVKEITLVDSKGLDHIEEGQTRKNEFKAIYYSEKDFLEDITKSPTDPFGSAEKIV